MEPGRQKPGPSQSNLQPLSGKTVAMMNGVFPTVLISGSLETALHWYPGDKG